MIQTDQTRIAHPADVEQGVQLFHDCDGIRIFHPSDARQNSLTLWMTNSDMTPVGMKGVWLADYCQQVLRNMNLSQRMINKMSIKLSWVFGSAGNETDGFSLGTHQPDWEQYDCHRIKICVGAEGKNGKVYTNKVQIVKTLTHELIHTAQSQTGRLNYTHFGEGDSSSCRYTFKSPTGIKQTGWSGGSNKTITPYSERGYELEAWANQTSLMNQTAQQVPDQECLGFCGITQRASMSDDEQQWRANWLNFRRGSFSGWV